MIHDIFSFEQLTNLAHDFQSLIDMQFHKDDIDACIKRLTELENIMTKSGKCLADAKYHQDKQQCSVKTYIEELGTAKVTPSILNNYIKAKTYDLNYLVNWHERINRSATHLCENMRTAISYLKEEMRNLNYKP